MKVRLHQHSITITSNRPFTLLGGVNVLEVLDFALRCAAHYKEVCSRLDIPLVFKRLLKKPAACRRMGKRH
jgi:2-dehydro-3-deoxyphosphooctonate aldolase (KDO 8-P synthase)